MSVQAQPTQTVLPFNAATLATLVCAGSGGESLEVRSPFDEAPLPPLPLSTVQDVDAAFVRARAAQKEWGAWPVKSRAAVVKRFAELVMRDRQQILDTIQLESGKARVSAFEEVADVAMWASYLVRQGPRHLRPRRRQGAFPVITRAVEQHAPKGVIGVITPWNYPFTLPASDTLPALLAGNAVVLKPDSQTPYSALIVASLLREAGLPEGVLQVVTGAGRTIGTAIIERSDYLMFTGSTATGRVIAERCGSRLVGMSAELGGKNAMLVLEDADAAKAAAGAVKACFANTGQLCVSIERIYVHQSQWDVFVPAFLSHVKEMRLSSGLGWDADMGSLTGATQLETVQGFVDDAVAHGAEVLTGGQARPDLGPYFYEPTVLAGVTSEMRLHREETFGPVVFVHPVATDEEAIQAANDSDYGLNASVWSARRGTEVAAALRVGTVNVNEGYAAAWASHGAPMGGMGSSGLGRRHGREGILKYTEAQTVATQHLLPVGGPSGVSNERWAQLLGAGVKLLRTFR